MMAKYKYWFYFLIAIFSFVLLQLVSWLFFKSGFSIFTNKKLIFFFSSPYFLIIVFLAVIAFIIFSLYEIKKRGDNPLIVISLALILGGGLSNFIDRLFKGGVADYFDLYFWKMNLADIFIFVGIFLFFYNYLKKGHGD